MLVNMYICLTWRGSGALFLLTSVPRLEKKSILPPELRPPGCELP